MKELQLYETRLIQLHSDSKTSCFLFHPNCGVDSSTSALSQLSIRGQDNPTLARSVSPLKFDQKLLMAPPPFPCEHRVCGMARCLRNDLELRSDENLSGHTQTHTLALVSRVCTPPNHACADKRSIFCQIKKHSVRPGPAHAHTQSSRC